MATKDAGAWVFRRLFEQADEWRFRAIKKRPKGSKGEPLIETRTLRKEALGAGLEVPKGKIGVKAAGDLLDLLAERARKAHHTPETAPKECTFADAVAEWLAIYHARLQRKKDSVRQSTIDNLTADFEIYGELLGRKASLLALDYSAFERLFCVQLPARAGRNWAEGASEPDRMSGTTLRRHARQLRHFLAWAVKKSYTRENHVARLLEEEFAKDWQAEIREGADVGKALSREEAINLLEACSGKFKFDTTPAKLKKANPEMKPTLVEATPPPWLRLAVLLALHQGLRRANLQAGPAGLRWGDVDLDRGVLRLDARRMKGKREFVQPLHPEVQAALRAELRRLGRVPRGSEHVIPAKDLSRTVGRAMERVGIEARFHDLRHTATTAYAKTTPEWATVQALADHSTKNTITGRYVHVSLETMREAIDRVPWFFPENPAALTQRQGS